MSESPIGTEHPAESVAVQLTRIEGLLRQVASDLTRVTKRVDTHEDYITDLRLTTQRLSDAAEAEARKAVALAVALKDAADVERAKADQERTKIEQEWKQSDRAWTPMSRFYAFLMALSALGTLIYFLVKQP